MGYIYNTIEFESEKDQKKLLSSDPAWLKKLLQTKDLTHPALARLSKKLDNPSDIFTTYTRVYSRSCFPAGTKVLLADNTTKMIEQISVGDVVLGFDGSSQVPVCVEELESPLRDHLCVLTFADGSTIKLTMEHPLYTKNGWRSLSPESTSEENSSLLVGKLEIGDSVLTVTGEYKTLVNIEFLFGEVQTYNIKKLSRYDNFFVNGFLAHNKSQLSLCGKCAPKYADFACRIDGECGAIDFTNTGNLSKKVDTQHETHVHIISTT